MIYVDVPIAEWREKHNLRRFVDCYRCGEPIELDTPVAISGYRGVMSMDGCTSCLDVQNRPMVFKPTAKEKVDFWKRFYGN